MDREPRRSGRRDASGPKAGRPGTGRSHTGRRRNEATRQAILDAAFGLIREAPIADITVDAIAKAAGASRQTVYRWWPAKGAVIAEALGQRAQALARMRDTGDLRADLTRFVAATFAAMRDPATGHLLRQLMASAQQDPHMAAVVADFTAQRRHELRSVLELGQQRGQLDAEANLDTLVDLAYGFLWYRLLVDHAPLDRSAATDLVDALLRPP